MASTGVRRRDTTKGPPLRILSLDGGGVRGYSMLIILQELMHRTYVEMEGRPPRRDQIPKPCDVFDLIVGTGTGGLIALMLGRLRMDLETCKEVYVRLTRVVFETDKTFAGIPFRSTLFKASRLEDAIRECVQEHTVFVGEGNDGASELDMEEATAATGFAGSAACSALSGRTPRRHSSNASVLSFSAKSPHAQMSRPVWHNKLGNPEARLYDARENRTKTAVTAVYKGTPKSGGSVLLRSYDSRREPAIEFDCKVWEAGRATCAISLAFKPIQIGQSAFQDEGAGTFNPSPEALDEAVVNEWPGREVGVFLSVGTGRRPKSSDQRGGSAASGGNHQHHHHIWYEGFLGGFAEARQNLISKIENCETIHEYMTAEHLARRGVNIENYYRLNVEMGVGEFGMNEWHRLSDISTSTRRYLMRDSEQKMVEGISTKLAKIHRARMRLESAAAAAATSALLGASPPPPPLLPPLSDLSSPLAAELPAEVPTGWPPPRSSPPSRQSYDSGMPDSLHAHRRTPSPMTPPQRASNPQVIISPLTPYPLQHQHHHSHHHQHHRHTSLPPLTSRLNGGDDDDHDHDHDHDINGGSNGDDQMGSDQFIVTAPTPDQYRTATGADKVSTTAESDERPRYYRYSQPPLATNFTAHAARRIEPPPIPPKTPLPDHHQLKQPALPPYPIEEDEPPPLVNMARKPDYRRR